MPCIVFLLCAMPSINPLDLVRFTSLEIHVNMTAVDLGFCAGGTILNAYIKEQARINRRQPNYPLVNEQVLLKQNTLWYCFHDLFHISSFL